jgi:hypothetical protein
MKLRQLAQARSDMARSRSTNLGLREGKRALDAVVGGSK